jgi:transcriptional regulator with XRE-family HTH domain
MSAARASRSGDRAIRRRPSSQRVRAARAWLGLERPAFAERTGISTDRLAYIENGKGDPRPDELEAIQGATGVPMWFLLEGFEGAVARTPNYGTAILDEASSFDLELLVDIVAQLDQRLRDVEGEATSRPSAQVAQLLKRAAQAQRQRREGSLQGPGARDRPHRVEEGGGG